jgi:hypothetical protein
MESAMTSMVFGVGDTDGYSKENLPKESVAGFSGSAFLARGDIAFVVMGALRRGMGFFYPAVGNISRQSPCHSSQFPIVTFSAIITSFSVCLLTHHSSRPPAGGG